MAFYKPQGLCYFLKRNCFKQVRMSYPIIIKQKKNKWILFVFKFQKSTKDNEIYTFLAWPPRGQKFWLEEQGQVSTNGKLIHGRPGSNNLWSHLIFYPIVVILLSN